MTKTELMQLFVNRCKEIGVKANQHINQDMTCCITAYSFKNSYIYEVETIDGNTFITDDINETMLYI